MEHDPTDHGSSEEAHMADPPPYPNSREEAGLPRWVKVLGIVVAVVVLLVVAIMFIGGGGHSPRRHGGAGGDAPSVAAARSGGSPSWTT
jgi:hypothetical protein